MTQQMLFEVETKAPDTRVAVLDRPDFQVIDPRTIPYQIDILDQWVEASSVWVTRWSNRNKRGKSPETIKVHARAFIDFFTYQLPAKPAMPGLDGLARSIAAGNGDAMLQMARVIREIITECYTQYRIASARGQRTGIKPPWLIDVTDVERWELDLEQRTYLTSNLVRGPRKSKKNPDGGTKRVPVEKKLSNESIAQRVAALSSFYIYVSAKHVVTHQDGTLRPLYQMNPVSPLPRHEIFQYGKATFLNADQIVALLKAVNANHTLTGLRDLALFTAFLYTGRRNSEIRELRWDNISADGKQYQTRTKGKKDHFEKADLPRPVYTAIVKYLKAADRLDGIQPADSIFIAHSDRAKHLRTRDGRSLVADTYAPGQQAISSREVGRLLKKYGRKAGLDETQLHVHVLRHSAAMLRKAIGDRLEDISAMLGHANFNTTKIYLEHMDGRQDVSWKKVEALIGLDDESN